MDSNLYICKRLTQTLVQILHGSYYNQRNCLMKFSKCVSHNRLWRNRFFPLIIHFLLKTVFQPSVFPEQYGHPPALQCTALMHWKREVDALGVRSLACTAPHKDVQYIYTMSIDYTDGWETISWTGAVKMGTMKWNDLVFWLFLLFFLSCVRKRELFRSVS